MKRFILLAISVSFSIVSNAQYYGGGNTKVGQTGKSSKQQYLGEFSTARNNTSKTESTASEWDGSIYGIGYSADFDFADKGGLGLSLNGFSGNDKHVGLSFMWNGIYNVGTEKFMNSYQALLGPNFYTAVTDNLIFYAPLCLSVSSMGDSDKIYWGGALIPSIGIKAGALFLSAGWNLFYNFSAKEDQFNSKNFVITLGIFTNR